MNFHSLYDQGFARVAAVTVPVHPAQPLANAGEVIDAARELDAKGVATAVFPELGISGYAIDDLLLQDVVLDEVTEALHRIAAQTKDLLPILIVGAPIRNDGSLYTCRTIASSTKSAISRLPVRQLLPSLTQPRGVLSTMTVLRHSFLSLRSQSMLRMFLASSLPPKCARTCGFRLPRRLLLL